MLVKDKFHFHFVSADGNLQDVSTRISKEFEYQSSLELGDDTFDSLRAVPAASEIIKTARQNLVQRLDSARRETPELFARSVDLIKSEFIHILQQQSLAGRAIIRSANPLLTEEPSALPLILDILSERGFFVHLDVVNRSGSGSGSGSHFRGGLDESATRGFTFHFEFPRPAIRGGMPESTSLRTV